MGALRFLGDPSDHVFGDVWDCYSGTQAVVAPSSKAPEKENCGAGLAIGLAQTGLDALGAIPGEKFVSLTAKGVLMGAQVLGGDASAAISVVRQDKTGIGFGAVGVPLSLAELSGDNASKVIYELQKMVS